MAVLPYLMMGSGETGRQIITGSRWVWGKNTYGTCGLGHETNVGGSITQLGSGETWQNTESPGNGWNHRLAVKSDGTLWSWGRNNSGCGGLGDTTSRSSPVQVGSDTDWKEAVCHGSCSSAIKTDNTLWAWGSSWAGGVAQGDTVDHSSPVQVGSDTDWAHVIASENDGISAMRDDGSLWWAGYGLPYGLSNASSITQAGSQDGFVDIVAMRAGYQMWKEA